MSRAVSQDKAVNELIRLGQEQGWEIKATANGHFQFKSPDGQSIVLVSSKVSNYRTFRNTKSDLQRAGMITSRTELNALSDNDKRRKLLLEKRYPQSDLLVRIFGDTSGALTDASNEIRALMEKDEGEANRVVDAFRGYVVDRDIATGITPDPSNVRQCFKCKDTFGSMWRLGDHWAECKTRELPVAPTPEPIKETPMKPLPRPALRDQVTCPDCPQVFYKSQEHLLAQHLADRHDAAVCPSCSKRMKPASLQIHLDKYCKVLHPGKTRRPRTVRIDPAVPTDEQVMAPAVPTPPPEPPPAPVAAPSPVPPPPTPRKSALGAGADDRTSRLDPEDFDNVVTMVPAPPPASELSDEELFALLNLVLNGPIELTPKSYNLVAEWIDVTRKLYKIKMEQGQ